MTSTVKFASQIDSNVFAALRAYASEEGRSISSIVSDSVSEYLAKKRVQPAFLAAADEGLDEHAELLARPIQ